MAPSPTDKHQCKIDAEFSPLGVAVHISGTHRSVSQPESHQRPAGLDDATVEAVGEVSEALEYVERARGHLYSFHQLMGHGDLLLGKACDKLREAGHDAVADGAIA